MTIEDKMTKTTTISLSLSGVFILIALGVFIPACSHGQRVEPKQYLPEKVRMLMVCQNCHLEKRPRSECDSQAQTWAWLECTRLEHLYPDE